MDRKRHWNRFSSWCSQWTCDSGLLCQLQRRIWASKKQCSCQWSLLASSESSCEICQESYYQNSTLCWCWLSTIFCHSQTFTREVALQIQATARRRVYISWVWFLHILWLWLHTSWSFLWSCNSCTEKVILCLLHLLHSQQCSQWIQCTHCRHAKLRALCEGVCFLIGNVIYHYLSGCEKLLWKKKRWRRSDYYCEDQSRCRCSCTCTSAGRDKWNSIRSLDEEWLGNWPINITPWGMILSIFWSCVSDV